MNIKIHSIRFTADRKLLDFINQKVNKLTLFDDDIHDAEIFLRLDKDQDMENKISEIKIDLPGGPLFAKKQSKTFEEATDGAIDALKKQITKNKEKKRTVPEGKLSSIIENGSKTADENEQEDFN